jgi:hypothetical protein
MVGAELPPCSIRRRRTPESSNCWSRRAARASPIPGTSLRIGAGQTLPPAPAIVGDNTYGPGARSWVGRLQRRCSVPGPSSSQSRSSGASRTPAARHRGRGQPACDAVAVTRSHCWQVQIMSARTRSAARWSRSRWRAARRLPDGGCCAIRIAMPTAVGTTSTDTDIRR